MVFKLFGSTITNSLESRRDIEGEGVDESVEEVSENLSSISEKSLPEEGSKEGLISEEIKVEAKIFSCQNVKEGFLLKELHRKWEREISISKDQLRWMMEILDTRSGEFKRHKEISSEIFVLGSISAKEKENDWGRYLHFYFGKGLFLIFPAGVKGKEWKRVSVWISECFQLISKCENRISAAPIQVTSQESVEFDKKISEMNSRLEIILEELRFFRRTVTEICSQEEEEEDTCSEISAEDRGELCLNLWKGEGNSGSEIDLSWEEQSGYSGHLERTEVSEIPLSNRLAGEDDADVSCGPFNDVDGLARELLLTAVQVGSDGINEGGSGIFEFEFEGITAYRTSKSVLGSSNVNPNTVGPLLVKGERDGFSKDRWAKSRSPTTIHTHLSRIEAFALLCRGSIFDQEALVMLNEELVKNGSAFEKEKGDDLDDWSCFAERLQCKSGSLKPSWERDDTRGIRKGTSLEDVTKGHFEEGSLERVVGGDKEDEKVSEGEKDVESESWLYFIGDNFSGSSGCLRPHWERCDRNEVIGALVDEGESSAEDEWEEYK